MSEKSFNDGVIEEFRANSGVVGGYFADSTVILLTTTGAKSGEKRTSPLVTVMDGDRYVLVASKGGAPTNPDWYHNLVANPEAVIEIGTETIPVRTVQHFGTDRDRLFALQAERYPGFNEYEKATTRVIPVFTAERA